MEIGISLFCYVRYLLLVELWSLMHPPSFPFEIEGVFDALVLVDLNLGLIHVAIVAFGLVYTDSLEVIVRTGFLLSSGGATLIVFGFI